MRVVYDVFSVDETEVMTPATVAGVETAVPWPAKVVQLTPHESAHPDCGTVKLTFPADTDLGEFVPGETVTATYEKGGTE